MSQWPVFRKKKAEAIATAITHFVRLSFFFGSCAFFWEAEPSNREAVPQSCYSKREAVPQSCYSKRESQTYEGEQ